MTRAGRNCLLISLALGLAWGCAPSGTLPPTAAIYGTPGGPLAPTTVMKPAPQVPPTLQVPGEGNPWKPTVAAREWKYIVLHHTASDKGSVESIHQAHLGRKDSAGKPWLGIGYHFVIGNGKGMSDGEIEPTFRWKQQIHGAHAKSNTTIYNQQGIGIVLVGNFQNGPPTPAQVSSVKRLVRTLKAAYGIADANVIGHKDVGSTECPGKHFPLSEIAFGTPGTQFGSLPPQPQQVIRTISHREDAAP